MLNLFWVSFRLRSLNGSNSIRGILLKPDVVVHTCNPSTWLRQERKEAEATLRYIVRPGLKGEKGTAYSLNMSSTCKQSRQSHDFEGQSVPRYTDDFKAQSLNCAAISSFCYCRDVM